MLNPTAKQTARNFANNFLTAIRQSVLSSLLLLLALSPALQAQGLNRNTTRKVSDETVLINPLERNDPRAQLDQQLLSAQPMPQSDAAENLAGEPGGVEFNLATGETKQVSGQTAASTKETAPTSGFAGPRQLADFRETQGERVDSENFLCVSSKTEIHTTAQYPWSTQVKLFMTFPNGGVYVGSGTLVASRYVITHQNNVYFPAFGGFPTRIEVIPGLDGTYKPFGSAFSSYLRYRYQGAANIGLITLDRHIGFSTGWLGYGNFTDSYLESRSGHIAGYKSPIFGADRVLNYAFGAVDVRSYDQAKVGVVYTGELGAGVYQINTSGQRYVWGVSAGAFPVTYVNGGAPRDICSTKADRLTNWIVGELNAALASGF